MKHHLLLFLMGILLANGTMAQPVDANRTDASEGRPLTRADLDRILAGTNTMPRFNLDFRGGTPKELVDSMTKAIGKPLNVVIPDDVSHFKMPAVSVRNVTVEHVFEAVTRASVRDIRWPSGATVTSTFGFRTTGQVSEDSVWYFFSTPKFVPFDICKFYQLGSHIDGGYRVEDITTAIEAGWKLREDSDRTPERPMPPKLTYHRDTRLLIAVGDPDKLSLIEDVLKQLPVKKPTPPDSGAAGQH